MHVARDDTSFQAVVKEQSHDQYNEHSNTVAPPAVLDGIRDCGIAVVAPSNARVDVCPVSLVLREVLGQLTLLDPFERRLVLVQCRSVSG